MKILILGATGLVGQALFSALAKDHQITVGGRNHRKLQAVFPTADATLTWEEITADPNHLAQFDCVINLAGANVGAQRWSKSRKRIILNSRVETTALIATQCSKLGTEGPRLINASAIGIYGQQDTVQQQQNTWYDEDSPSPTQPNDFLAQVGKAWEQALLPAEQAGVSVIKLRFAVILSNKGGALAKMLPSFKMGLGAIIGTGKQPFSWVSLTDVIAAISFLLKKPDANGSFNLVADEVVSQKVFAKTLAKIMKRPCINLIPSFVINLVFGEMGQTLLLNGQQVKGEKLQSLGFIYQESQLEPALRKIMTRKS